jgi:uncharacterized SAM-binding protein YcdF (DUF218 family)
MTQDVETNVKILWEYHRLHQPLKKADCIFVLGSHDLRVADRAVELYRMGLAPYIIFSGGVGKLTQGLYKKSEAETLADIARQQGVPENRILIEGESTNTGENIRFVKQLLEEKKLDFHSFILVQKPYMERRTYATFMKQWPGQEIMVTSSQLSFDEYVSSGNIPKEDIINTMVGDTERIKIYPEKGFQILQEMPDIVWRAFQELVAAGYSKHLINQQDDL